MPRPLIINVQSQRRSYQSGPNAELLEYAINDNFENHHRDSNVSRSEYNLSDHHRRHGKKSKHAHREKESPRRHHPGHKRMEKNTITITRSKSMADLKRNPRSRGQEEECSKKYQRRHSNTEPHSKMFNFRETFSKFENLTTEPQNGNIERESQPISSHRTKGRSTVEKEASDLREIDQIKSRARLLVQEARQIGRRDKQNYFEWQDEVIQLLMNIGEIDNRNSEAVQKEKQKTLRIFKQSYPSSEVRKVEKIKIPTVRNDLSESKTNVYDEADLRTVKVSQLKNIYEYRQPHETPKPVTIYKETKYYSEQQNSNKKPHEQLKPQNLDDSEYTSSSRYSVSSSSASEEENVYEIHEDETYEQPPRERNVEEHPIAKVRDLRGVFEKDNNDPDEELPPTSIITKLPAQIVTRPAKSTRKYEERAKASDEEIYPSKTTKLPTHIVTRPSKWIIKTDEEVPQKESSGIHKVDDKGFIIEPTDDGPKTVRDTLSDKEILHSVTVKKLKHVFEANGPSQNLEDVHTSTMRVILEQKYIPYEEYVDDGQQTVVITELNTEENDKEKPVDTSHIAKVKQLKDAIERNEDNCQITTEVNQVRYQVASAYKHQSLIEIERSERVAVISELTSTNGDSAIDEGIDEDLQYGPKEDVTVKSEDSNEESSEAEKEIKHNVIVKETELTDQEKVLISKKVLDVIYEDIHSYEKEIDNLDSGDEKKKMFLNEMLLRSVIQLENFETYQSEELLRERKEALLFVRECIRKLKENIPEETKPNS